MAWDRYEYTILQHFLSALINGDHTGLNDKEEEQFTWFVNEAQEKLPPDCISSHWSVDVEDCTNFAKCEITGMLGNVSDVALVFQIPDKKDESKE